MAASSNASENKLLASWHDTSWIPVLNQYNVMEYFSQRSNPFYDRTCNNESIRMQRADPAQLVNMVGIEYSLLIVQEPILYVIRKVHRQSCDKVVPLADYYVLSGVVYQCPDLLSIINSRMLSTVHLVHQAFEEALSYVKYDCDSGYKWNFPGDTSDEQPQDKVASETQEEPSEHQRRRVDNLLLELVRRYPLKTVASKEDSKPVGIGGSIPRGLTSDAGVGGVRKAAQYSGFNENKPPDLKRTKTSM